VIVERSKCPTPEWVSGKPHKKSAAETAKEGRLATTVFTGGKLKISAHQLNLSQHSVDYLKGGKTPTPDENK
jgi:hypothetical protein